MEFVQFNANPKGWKTGDCVVRAISKATNTSWEVTYLRLCEIGASKCRMPNDKIVFELLLKNLGWQKHKMPRHSDNSRYTVRELADEFPTDEMIVSVAHHLSFVSYGTLIDTWNCGSKSVGNYWTRIGS